MTKQDRQKIGEVIHFFGDIEVAIIRLSGSLEVGDEIGIVGGEDTDFTQTVESMEADHEKVELAKKGEEIGIKVESKVRKGYEVYKA